MNWKKSILCAWMVAATLTLADLSLAADPPAAGAAREIQMTAKKYEFDPSTVTVKKGERVKLVITSLDRDHGIKIEAFKVKQALKKGEATTVEFIADKAGEFPFICSKFCGFGHNKMKGKFIVQE